MIKTCFVTSEIHPFSKAGGLADVSSALASCLSRNGHDVRVFSPLYASIDTKRHALKRAAGMKDLAIRLGGDEYSFSTYTAGLAGCDAKVYFVHCPALYDRPSIYTSDPDEHRRFILLTRSVFESCRKMKWIPDILHGHDWPAALGPLFRRSIYAADRVFEATKTVLTVHNMGYQGIFSSVVREDTVPAEHAYLLHQDDLRAGVVNFLKTGLLYADAVTTVSPTYAREIRESDLGSGLRQVLDSRPEPIRGILNGIDDREWSPQKDRWIEKNYNARGPVAGKGQNKKALLERLGLPVPDRVPLVAMITRLVPQKGIDLLYESIPGLLEGREFQLVVLGSGEERYQEFFQDLQRRFPSRVCFYQGYSDELAHLTVAGADVFLMPSLYEPCGLSPMYSLNYGTVPVVRKTGGLVDTVQPWNPETKEGVGFVFEHYTPEGVRWGLDQALDTYRNRTAWLKLMRNGMATDFSWDRRIGEYLELYDSLTRRA